MQGITAVVIGATGLIGNELVQELLNDAHFKKVNLLVRRKIAYQHPKLESRIVNFENEQELEQQLGEGDVIFCCVGTTRKKVNGNKEAYRKVDYDIPMTTARLGIKKGFSQYLLISAIGANAFSGNFYLHLKGSLEEDIMVFPYQSIHIFRPSILLGKRPEFRLGEVIGKGVMQAVSFLLVGSLSKYKPVQGKQVAKAMIGAVKKSTNGVEIYEYDEMKALVELKSVGS